VTLTTAKLIHCYEGVKDEHLKWFTHQILFHAEFWQKECVWGVKLPDYGDMKADKN